MEWETTYKRLQNKIDHTIKFYMAEKNMLKKFTGQQEFRERLTRNINKKNDSQR